MKKTELVDALATATGIQPSALQRVLRPLTAEGIFVEEASGIFAQTPLSNALRANAAGSPRDFLRMIGREPSWRGDNCSKPSAPGGQASNSYSVRRPAHCRYAFSVKSLSEKVLRAVERPPSA